SRRRQGDDFAQGGGGAEMDGGGEFLDYRFAAAQVVEARAVGLFVGNKFNGGFGVEDFDDHRRQVANADFLGAADVEDLAARSRAVLQAHQGFHGVADVTEAAGLL